MKKLLALLLVLGLLACGCTGSETGELNQTEEIAAWNLEEKIHPQLK